MSSSDDRKDLFLDRGEQFPSSHFSFRENKDRKDTKRLDAP